MVAASVAAAVSRKTVEALRCRHDGDEIINAEKPRRCRTERKQVGRRQDAAFAFLVGAMLEQRGNGDDEKSTEETEEGQIHRDVE